MKKYLVAIVVILALLVSAETTYSQFPTRDYFANYLTVSGLAQFNDNVPVRNYGYYWQTYNYNTADAFRVDYHGVGHYIMNLQANGTSVLTLNKAGNLGVNTTNSLGRVDIVGANPATDICSGLRNLLIQQEVVATAGYHSLYNVLSEFDIDPVADSSGYYFGVHSELGPVTGNSVDYTKDITGVQGQVDHYGTGSVNRAFGVVGIVTNRSSGTIASARGATFEVFNYSSGEITDVHTVLLANHYHSGIIRNKVGLTIADMTGATNNTELLLGTVTIPTGDFAIYNASTADSYFAGSLGLNTTGPDATLDVLNASSDQLCLTHTDGTFYNKFKTISTGGLEITSNFGSVFKVGTSPGYNLFIGEDSGEDIIADGVANTCAGAFAGRNITDGDYNTLYGYCAGDSLVSAIRNTLIGGLTGQGMTGSYNIAVGYEAMQYGSSSAYCVAVGYNALRGPAGGTSGAHNTAVGAMALDADTSGQYNMALGREALTDNTSGHYNTAVGALALQHNTIARLNVGIGYTTGAYNAEGWNNTYIGAYAGLGVSGNNNSNNVFIGYQAGDSVTTGSDNIVIGYTQDLPAPATNYHLNIGGILKGDMNLNELHIPSELVLTPSAAQVIDAVGDAILANASYIELNPDGDYTLTSQPTVADGTKGQVIRITCADGEANIVTVQDEDTLANSNIHLQAASRAVSGRDILVLVFNGSSWCEESYSNN